MNQPHILSVESVQAGDVILCRAPLLDRKFQDATGNQYSHAGIALGDGLMADASANGVQRARLQEVVNEYSHAAVLRHPDGWNEGRIAALNAFVDDAVTRKRTFNRLGMHRWAERRKQHEADLMYKVPGFVSGAIEPPKADRACYFCSEFIASIYIELGLIGSAAAGIFDPKVTSPAQLVDGAYGFFAGYLVPYAGYTIPDDDDFRMETPLHQILESE